jgi:hypothetical protein
LPVTYRSRNPTVRGSGETSTYACFVNERDLCLSLKSVEKLLDTFYSQKKTSRYVWFANERDSCLSLKSSELGNEDSSEREGEEVTFSSF